MASEADTGCPEGHCEGRQFCGHSTVPTKLRRAVNQAQSRVRRTSMDSNSGNLEAGEQANTGYCSSPCLQ